MTEDEERLIERLRAHFRLDENGKPTKWMYWDDFERIVSEHQKEKERDEALA